MCINRILRTRARYRRKQAGKIKAKKKKKNGLENRTEGYQFVFPSGRKNSASLDEPRSTVAPTRLTKLRRNVSWGARETCSLILPEWNIHGRVHARRYATKPLCRVSALVKGRSKGGRFRGRRVKPPSKDILHQ